MNQPSPVYSGACADLVLRAPRPEDAGACGGICFEAFQAIAGRHGFPPDFDTREQAAAVVAHFLGAPHVRGTVAEVDGRVSGSNFLSLEPPVAGVGPITVAPSAQNANVGRRLMEWAIEQARREGCASVRLVQAAYHGRSLALYSKLGFVVREPLAALQGEPLRLSFIGRPVRAAQPADVEACNRLCERVHGHARAGELAGAVERGTASVVERDGRITGYSTELGFFGHAVAETNDDLAALIGAAECFSGPGFLLPTRNAALFGWCLERGLRIVQPMSLMSLGLYNEPSAPFLPSILY